MSLPAIPIDVIITIFSKLNLKSIVRCRCVSKLWASILRRSDFTELFFSTSCSRGPNLLFIFRNESNLIFSSPHPQNLANNLSRLVINYQMKFSTRSCNYFKNYDLVNGLICDRRILNGKEERVLMIRNPSTGQALMLPTSIRGSYYVWSLFGYDPIDKQFKVLAMTTKHSDVCAEFQVLTIGSGNMSWRMIEGFISHTPPGKNICINGVLYYTSIDTKTCKVVCFDIRFEKFTFIEVMGTLKEVMLDGTIDLINYNGKLGLLQRCGDNLICGFFDGISVRFKLWVLEDIEKQEWSDHMFLFSDVPKNLDYASMLRFAGVTQRKEIVFWTLWSKYPNSPFYVFYLNLEKKTIKRVEIEGMDVENVAHMFVDHVENVNLYASV